MLIPRLRLKSSKLNPPDPLPMPARCWSSAEGYREGACADMAKTSGAQKKQEKERAEKNKK